MFRRVDVSKVSLERATETLNRFRKTQIEKVLDVLNLHIRASAHIPTTFPFERLKIADSKISINGNVTDKKKFVSAIVADYDKYIDVLRNKNVWYVIKSDGSKSYFLLFYGTEQDVYKHVMINAAKAVDWVPKIENGMIIGGIDLKDIIDVTFKYNRDYGMLLKDLYDKGKYFIRPQ